jgi:hypothetical protein
MKENLIFFLSVCPVKPKQTTLALNYDNVLTGVMDNRIYTWMPGKRGKQNAGYRQAPVLAAYGPLPRMGGWEK